MWYWGLILDWLHVVWSPQILTLRIQMILALGISRARVNQQMTYENVYWTGSITQTVGFYDWDFHCLMPGCTNCKLQLWSLSQEVLNTKTESWKNSFFIIFISSGCLGAVVLVPSARDCCYFQCLFRLSFFSGFLLAQSTTLGVSLPLLFILVFIGIVYESRAFLSFWSDVDIWRSKIY